jgi:hypothetical protein
LLGLHLMTAILEKPAVDRDLLIIPIPGCVARRQSLTITSEDGFKNAGRALAEFDSCSQWLWADYQLYAEKYGYRTVLEDSRPDLHHSTIRSYIDAGRFYAVKDRHPDLSFSHHAAVMYLLGLEASITDAKKWLARAAANKWTVGELREAVRTDKRRDEGDPGPMRGVVRITDFVKVSRFCASLHAEDLPPTEIDELRQSTGPLYQFLCEIHRPKFGS